MNIHRGGSRAGSSTVDLKSCQRFFRKMKIRTGDRRCRRDITSFSLKECCILPRIEK